MRDKQIQPADQHSGLSNGEISLIEKGIGEGGAVLKDLSTRIFGVLEKVEERKGKKIDLDKAIAELSQEKEKTLQLTTQASILESKIKAANEEGNKQRAHDLSVLNKQCEFLLKLNEGQTDFWKAAAQDVRTRADILKTLMQEAPALGLDFLKALGPTSYAAPQQIGMTNAGFFAPAAEITASQPSQPGNNSNQTTLALTGPN